MNHFILVFLLVSLSMPSLSLEEREEEATAITVDSVATSKPEPNTMPESMAKSVLQEPLKKNKLIEAPLTTMPLKSLPSASLRKPSDISTLSNWPVVIMALLGMIFLILALGWLVKRFSGVNFSGGQNMKIMSSLALGAKERVSLVEVNGTQFLLGVTSQSINHLHTFDTELSGKEMYSEEDKFSLELKNKNRKGGFSEKLNQLLDNKLNSSNTDELEK